jgi:SHS2 domain-containing protein
LQIALTSINAIPAAEHYRYHRVERTWERALEMTAHWEHYSHEADIGVRGIGGSEAQAFEQAGLALTAVVADLDRVEPREQIVIACEAPDDELLFVDWLNSLIYEMSTRKMLFSRFSVRLQANRLSAEAWGEPVDPDRHQPAVEIKGATYTSLRVARCGAEWLAQTVVDV